MRLELVWLRHQSIIHVEFMMYRLFSVWKFLKDIPHKFLKLCSILKELKYYLQDSIEQLGYGMSNPVKLYKFCKDTMTRYFLVNSITKVIQL